MNEELVKKLARGELSFHQIGENCSLEEAPEMRRKALEQMTGVKLEHVGKYSINLAAVTGKNIDNPVGAVQVPVGVAGPLKVKAEGREAEHPIFLATTEGALVASVNRGCSALNKAGGARAIVLKDEMTRAPAFRCESAGDSVKFVEWVKGNEEKIRAEAESTTKHGKLVSITPFFIGRTVWLRFSYHTGEASGLNMVTIATKKAVDFIQKSQELAKCIALSGNACIDKKTSAMNFILGRGKSVIAEATIPAVVLEEVLKCTPEEFVEVNYRKNLLGSVMAGAHGFNAHAANPAAAMLIALGQDEAHAVDASYCVTSAEANSDGSLYVSVTMPSVYVGSLGGGTRVETQKELLGATGVESARELACVLASAVLAGEISLVGALATGTLASAHAELGR